MGFSHSYPARLRVTVFLCILLSGTAGALFGQTSQRSQREAIEAHFAAAQDAQAHQDYNAAKHEYEAVLALAPNFAEVYMNLGLLDQLQNRIPDAMVQFRQALKLKPTLPGANFFLGVDYCKLGEASKAIRYLRAAVTADPSRSDTWLWLATAQEMSGQALAELTTLKRALKLQPKNVDLLYLLGRTYEGLGKDEVATIQRLAPKSSRAEQLLAESYATSNQWPSAVIHFQNALAASPNTSGLHVELGEVFLRAGKLRQAIDEFEAELQMNASNLRAIVRRGEAKLIRGEVDGALQDWSKAIAIDPAQVERVLGIRQTGFSDAALEQLPEMDQKKLAQLAPELRNRNTAAARLALAFIAAQTGSTSQLAGDYVDAGTQNANTKSGCSEARIRTQLNQGHFSGLTPCALRGLEGSSANFRIQVAGAMVEAGDYEPALALLAALPLSHRQLPEVAYWRARGYEKLATAAYLQLYEADPNSYRLHQLMGDLEASRGDDRKAMEEYRDAVAAKPSIPNLHYSLGHLLWKNLDVSGARSELEAELSINPHHAGALHDLGNTYLLEHQPEKALQYLNRALAIEPDSPDIHLDIGTAYTQLSQFQKAEAEYKIALPTDHDGSIHYKLAKVYQALKRSEEAAREFAISSEMNRQSHDKLEKQTQRLAEIEQLPQ
jgi:tetratricopeptide (TPR) repeat protein